MSIDIETKGKNKNESLLYTKATIRLIALHAEGESWFVDCDHLPDENVSSLLKVLEDKPKYFHNSAFDVPRIYRRFGVLLNKNVWDTLIASRAARAGEWEENVNKRPKLGHDLVDCLKRELGIAIPKVRQKWSGPLIDEHLVYAGDDVAHLKELYDALYERIEELGVKPAYDAVAATVHMFLESAALGVPVNAAMLGAIQTEVGNNKVDLEAELEKLSPEHPEGLEWIWRNSDRDTRPEGKGRAGVHRMLQLVGVKLPNLEEQTLLDNREKHPLVKALYEYRKVASVYSKYHRYLPDFCEDGKLYPQVKVAGAVTGRVLYTEPNIQGMDKKKTAKYRKCVRAEEGHSIVKGDFAQQELRIAAYFSEDEALMTAFANGEDVYMRVAQKIVGEPVTRGTPEGDNARAAAKRAVLGYLYGLGPAKYRENVYKDTGSEISEEEAIRDREAFRAAYPGFYRWQKKYGAYKDETNLPKPDMWETRSVRGWRRVVAGQYERKSEWKKQNNVPAEWIPKYTERLNGPIQSTAGDILYLTLSKLDADLKAELYPGTRFLFTAHDEVVLTCPEDIAREVAAWLKSQMVEAFEEVLGPKLGGRKSVEVGGGPSWGECEEWSSL
jgi:DNA polymerase I